MQYSEAGTFFASANSFPPIRISRDTQNKVFNNCNISVEGWRVTISSRSDYFIQGV